MKVYPVYQDARNQINFLIINRLMDKNSKPTPQKVFTRPGDWKNVAREKKLVPETISYEILFNLNIRLGPYNVLETGPPPLPLPSPNTTTNTNPPTSAPELVNEDTPSSSTQQITSTALSSSIIEGNYSILSKF